MAGVCLHHVDFETECEAKPGEDTVVVTGSDPLAGSWNPQNSKIVLEPSGVGAGGGRRWTASIGIPAGTALEFKFVVLSRSGSRWEDRIPNRKMSPLRSAVKYTGKFNEVGKTEKTARNPSPAGQKQQKVLAQQAPPPEAQPVAPPPPKEEDLGPEALRHVKAVKKREQFRTEIAQGDAGAKKAKEESNAGAAVELASYERLCSHRASLEGLQAELEAQATSRQETAAEHRAAAKCLEEELGAVTRAAAAAHERIEAVRRERARVAEEGRDATVAADEAEAAAAAAAAAAAERQAAAAVAAAKLQARSDIKAAEAEAAAQESKFRAEAARAIEEEHSMREAERQAACEASEAAAAAMLAHREEASRRARALETELELARQRAAAGVALRDMKSRELVTGVGFSASQQAAADHYAKLVRHVEATQKRQAESQRIDAAEEARLAQAAEESTMKLAECDHVVGSLRGRLADRRQAARRAAAAHAAAAATAAAAAEECELISARANGPLAKEAARREAEAAAARDDAAAVRKKASADEAPLRHQEEGEAQALARLREAEARLAQALSQARGAAAGAADAEDDEEEPTTPPAPTAPLTAIAEEVAQEGTAEEEAAAEEKEEAAAEEKEEAAAEEEKDAAAEEVEAGAPTAKAEEVKAVQGEEGAQRAQGAVAEAKAVEALPRRSADTTLDLVAAELVVVGAQIRACSDRETALRAEAQRRGAAWSEEKKGLLVSLHLADLEVASAKEDMRAIQQLRASSPIASIRKKQPEGQSASQAARR